MQKYVYSFQSAVGIFWIRPERDKSWGLYIGGEGIVELLGFYGSAFAAADSIYTQITCAAPSRLQEGTDADFQLCNHNLLAVRACGIPTLGNNGKIYRSLRWQQELP